MPNTTSRDDRDKALDEVLEMLRWEDDGGRNVGSNYGWLASTRDIEEPSVVVESEVDRSQLQPPRHDIPNPTE